MAKGLPYAVGYSAEWRAPLTNTGRKVALDGSPFRPKCCTQMWARKAEPEGSRPTSDDSLSQRTRNPTHQQRQPKVSCCGAFFFPLPERARCNRSRNLFAELATPTNMYGVYVICSVSGAEKLCSSSKYPVKYTRQTRAFQSHASLQRKTLVTSQQPCHHATAPRLSLAKALISLCWCIMCRKNHPHHEQIVI